MTDSLPAGLTYVSASSQAGVVILPTSGNGGGTNNGGPAGTVTETNGTVTDTIGTLAPGQTVTLTLAAMPTRSGTITNTAVVTSSSGISASGTAAASDTITIGATPATAADISVSKIDSGIGKSITPGQQVLAKGTDILTVAPAPNQMANLAISKIVSPGTGTIGQNLTYTITVDNTGGSAANDVMVIDALPGGETFVSSSASAGSANQANGTITANLGTIAAGASDTLTIVVTPTQTGNITNTASLTTSSPNAGTITTASNTINVGNAGGSGNPPAGVCYLAGQPGDNTDATFIRNLYRELLGREPDPSRQAAFMAFLQAGGSGVGQQAGGARQQAVEIFLNSTEYHSHLVGCIYENFLGHQADAGGLQFFSNQLANGVGERVVIAEIDGSAEAYARDGGTSQGFVNALYRDILGRAPDAASATNGTLQRVVEDFLSTSEAEHDVLNAAPGATSPAAGSPAVGSDALANLTGNGFENLYFQGNVSPAAADAYFATLQGGGRFEAVIEQMLTASEYYNAAS